MRILFFNRWVGCHLGGTEKHIIGLATGLAGLGHEVHVLTTEGNELNEHEKTLRVWGVSKNRREKLYSRGISEDPFLIFYAVLFLLKTIPRMLQMRSRGLKFDAISVHSPLEGLFLFLLRRILTVPYVFVLEGYSRQEVWLAQFADSAVALSDSLAERCQSELGYRPEVIPVGTDLRIFNPDGPRLPEADHRRIILTVSRLSTHKRIDILIHATKLLLARLPPDAFKVYIGGDGKDRMIFERMVKDTGVEGEVIFAGRIPELDLPRYYRSAQVFVSCEAAPDDYWITCEEAMCCGTPIIWTSRSANADRLEVRNWGLTVPLGRADILAEAIAELLQNETFRKDLRNRGLERAPEFDWKQVIHSYEKIYQHASMRTKVKDS
jgi:glycosyltransferase involved in cell wall biosynthesis